MFPVGHSLIKCKLKLVFHEMCQFQSILDITILHRIIQINKVENNLKLTATKLFRRDLETNKEFVESLKEHIHLVAPDLVNSLYWSQRSLVSSRPIPPFILHLCLG